MCSIRRDGTLTRACSPWTVLGTARRRQICLSRYLSLVSAHLWRLDCGRKERTRGTNGLLLFIETPSLLPIAGSARSLCSLLTLSSPCVGTGVQVFGQVPPASIAGFPTSSYVLDGKDMGTFTPTPGTETLYNQSFFAVHGLTIGDHELVITNVNGTAPNAFWLDFFEVDVPEGVVLPTGGSSTSGTTGATGTSTSTAGTGSVTAAPDSAVNEGGKKNVGAIVGGVVGGAVFLVLVSIIICLWMRLRRLRTTSACLHSSILTRTNFVRRNSRTVRFWER